MDSRIRNDSSDKIDEQGASNPQGHPKINISSTMSLFPRTKNPTALLIVALSQPLNLHPAPIKIPEEIKVYFFSDVFLN